MLSPPGSRSRREGGQVVVLFALLIPVLFAIGAIVIDVGNWYVHKRHLQTQVDAAVLASGPQFVGCFSDPAAANAAIASRALAYAGDTLRLGKIGPNAPDSTTNTQLAEPNDVRVVLNSSRYWGPSDGKVPGGNGYGLDSSIAVPGDPCSTVSLDAKATDEDVRPLWGLVPFTPSPKTRAKVEIRDLQSIRGMLPWAVPETDPARVAVLFVNESNGAVFDWQYLDDDPGYDNDGNPATSFPFSAWTTSVGMEPVTLGGANDRTSVVVLVSKNNSTPPMGGTLAQICGQSPGLIKCYAGSSQTSGLSFIHAYSGGFNGTFTSPQARQVELFASGCGVVDFSAPHFTLDGGCSATVQAVIDFGPSGSPSPLVAPVCALVDGMTWSAGGIGGALGTWTGSMSLPAASGRQALTIQTHTGPRANNPALCPAGNNRPNDPALGVVAAPYVANTASGRVQYLKLAANLASSGVPVGDANSVEKDNYLYRVTVGLPKPLSVGNYMDLPLVLRNAAPSGSQNQAFDCDKNRTFEQEIETGCLTTYTENYVDPDGPGPMPSQWNNLQCTGWSTGNLPPPTIGPGPPPYPSDCVMTETGDKTGQLRQGLAARFESPCLPNFWPDDATQAADFFGPNGGGYGNDPRYVTLVITDDTAFGGQGNEPLPIKYFAGFYVTGWDIGGATNGCPDPDGAGPLKGNDCHPLYGCSYPPSRDNGDVWGYFVDIVLFSGAGDPSDNLCSFGGDPAACIAVLVE